MGQPWPLSIYFCRTFYRKKLKTFVVYELLIVGVEEKQGDHKDHQQVAILFLPFSLSISLAPL